MRYGGTPSRTEVVSSLELDEVLLNPDDAERQKLEQLEQHQQQIEDRINNAFEFVAAGQLPGDRFKSMLAKWESEQKHVAAEIDQLRATKQSRLADAATIIELAQHAGTLYESCDQE